MAIEPPVLGWGKGYRALRKAQGIHEKLGGSGIIDEPAFKPEGMHCRSGPDKPLILAASAGESIMQLTVLPWTP